eukprot:8484562-Alexandrium_andersonii.AAC.1
MRPWSQARRSAERASAEPGARQQKLASPPVQLPALGAAREALRPQGPGPAVRGLRRSAEFRHWRGPSGRLAGLRRQPRPTGHRVPTRVSPEGCSCSENA